MKSLRPGFVTALHIHEEDERLYILEGTLSVRRGGRAFRATPGSIVTIPLGIAHQIRVSGPTPARVLYLESSGCPGGGCTVRGRTRDVPPPWRPDLAKLAALQAAIRAGA